MELQLMKTAFVSGGSRGIGKATVEAFLEAGYKVITTSTIVHPEE